MACLMHHKFILIDAEPKRRATNEGGDSVSDSESEEEEECELCEKCMASEESDNVPKQKKPKCLQCSPVRIRSKEDLIKFPSETLPRLPKHGLLITGSLNWTMQVRVGGTCGG